MTEVMDNQLFYKKVGTGPHLSFLHGFCEDHLVWQKVIDLLKDHFTCTLIDIPGFGQSAQLPIPSLEELAHQIAETCLSDSEPSILFGHSMGGYIALEIQRHFPELIRGLGLIHSTAFADSPAKKEGRKKVIEFMQSNPSESFLKTFRPHLVAEHRFNDLESELNQLVRDVNSSSIVDGTRAMMLRRDHSETLKHTSNPVLFLAGEQDDFIPIEDVRKQTSFCQLAHLEVLDQCGHLSMVEDPEKCALTIKEFSRFVAAVQ